MVTLEVGVIYFAMSISDECKLSNAFQISLRTSCSPKLCQSPPFIRELEVLIHFVTVKSTSSPSTASD